MVVGGMHGCRGHAWLQGACMVGGWGACVIAVGAYMVGGHAWLRGHALLWGDVWLWGACMVAGRCAWLQGACVVMGGIHGCRGACVVVRGMCGCGGHAWLWGVHGCRGGGVHGCWGACVGHDDILSMSGRYASYWNAFLFCYIFKIKYLFPRKILHILQIYQAPTIYSHFPS